MDLPIVDLDLYLSGDPASENVREECGKVCISVTDNHKSVTQFVLCRPLMRLLLMARCFYVTRAFQRKTTLFSLISWKTISISQMLS